MSQLGSEDSAIYDGPIMRAVDVQSVQCVEGGCAKDEATTSTSKCDRALTLYLASYLCVAQPPSAGVIAGAVVGAVVGAIALVLCITYCASIRMPKPSPPPAPPGPQQQQQQQGQPKPKPKPQPIIPVLDQVRCTKQNSLPDTPAPQGMHLRAL